MRLNDKDIYKTFGRAIQEIRKMKDISQEDLSFKAELHRTYISDIERGSRNVSLLNICKLAFALDIEVSSLFKHFESII